MSVFKCKMCGGALEIKGNETVAVCEYCGTKQTLPKLDDEKRAQLYDRANYFRRQNEFDKAMGIYENVTWETCTLRKWLNNDFINTAFSADEKIMIPTVTVSADENPKYSANPGNATQDQVFLLSITEANKYFNSNGAGQCEPTDYAVANGAFEFDSGNCCWWLRSHGSSQNAAALGRFDGYIHNGGDRVNDGIYAVRPALWVNLE